MIDTDPGLEIAGWCAARVYELLLKVSAQYDLYGRIPAERKSSVWLAKRWNLTAADLPGVRPEDFIANGIARLLETGKLIEDGDAWVIRGWEKFYRPAKTAAERKAEQRKREDEARARAEQLESRNVTPVTKERDSRDCHATPHHSTPHHVTKTETPPRESASVGALEDGIESEFLKQRGVAYSWTAADKNALRQKMGEGVPEILRRWAIALATRYPRCSSVVDLVRRWNDYAAPEAAGPPKDARKGIARAEDSNHSKNKVQADGTIDF
jgi:hypothetical protein